ncbi:MAG: hypothetical protein K2Q25_06600 [Mycobacteriaceae bacterium]|nr:hypothetical protein [Mycobacteriaceae bacterium]
MKRKLAQVALAVIAASMITTLAMAAPDHRTTAQSGQHSVSAAPASKPPGGGGVEVEGGGNPTEDVAKPESAPSAGGQSSVNAVTGGTAGGCTDMNTGEAC